MAKSDGSIRFGSLKICKDDFERLNALANKESDEDSAILARIVMDILHELDLQNTYELEQHECG